MGAKALLGRRFYLVWLFVGTLVLTALLGFFGDIFAGKTVWLTLCGMALLVGAAVWLTAQARITPRHTALLIFLVGLLLRLCYILYTDVGVRQHDMGAFGQTASGHAAYIQYFLDTGGLPDFDPRSRWQFYHPPLHHMLSAAYMAFQMRLGISPAAAAEGLQFLTFFYSSCCMVISYRIFQALRLRGAGLLCAFALVAFSPSFMIFSGSVNNDILSITFVLGAILAGLRWAKAQGWTPLIQLALCIGLGMMTKTSAGIAAPCTAAVFALAFFKRRADKRRLLCQFGVFAAICLPLGLFWATRNLVQFGDPCLSVPLLSSNSEQYIGSYSAVQRFLLPIKETFSSEFMLWGPVYENYALAGLLKSSAFGEFILTRSAPMVGWFSPFLLFFNVMLAFFGLYGGIRTAAAKSLSPAVKVLTCGNYLITLISYFVFCYSFPHTCTMNIRYAAPLLVLTAFFVGRQIKTGASGARKWRSRTAVALSIGFCFFSVMVYTVLGI